MDNESVYFIFFIKSGVKKDEIDDREYIGYCT